MTPEQLTGKCELHLTKTLVDDKIFLIHQAVAQDFLALKQAAKQAGYQLQIASGFRHFQRQLSIWNRKFSGETPILDVHSQPLDIAQMAVQEKILAILRWSALPGASRHHWGTDFDVYDRSSLLPDTTLLLEPWEYLSGHQAKFSSWLGQHLEQFGFFLPYDRERGGVSPEPWHISHQKIATDCLRQLTPEMMSQALEDEPILGKIHIQKSIHTIYNQYVININQANTI